MDMKTVPCLLRKHSSSVYLFILLVHHIFGRGSCKFLKGKPVELVCFFSAFRLGPVEKRFSAWTLSSSVFLVSLFARAERSFCRAKRKTLSSLKPGREKSTPEKLGTSA